ncbi:MAG: RHS repeat protein, partial [Proteobacteria bacterium]|nr:RHS repeat protein [Pseudomonadota bacterium]
MSDPDMGYWTYAYDLNGNLASQTDARGTTITFEYDALNRLTRKGYPDQSFAQYEYDGAENGIGFLYMKYNASAFTRYHSYDARGRLSSEIRMIGTTMIKFDYTYDFAGRQSSKSIYRNWTLFKTLRFEFYPESSLLKAVLNENSQPYTTVTQYSPQGKIEFMNHYNNTVTNYIYDYETGRISVIHSYNMSQDIIDKNYAYSQAGDVTQISNNRTGITYTYDYDHLHRLVSEQSSGDNAVAGTQVDIIEFTYAQQPGTPVHAPTQTRLNGALTEYNYTSTGNRLNRNSGIENTIYESNPDNLISKIIQGGVETTFYYDADTKRIKKTQGLSSTLYFGEDFEIINNTSTLYIFAGNLRVAK